MSDIVERLRTGHPSRQTIERLRAALQPDILADNDVRKTAPALEKRADILPDTAAAVANERAAILELIDSERDRVPKTGEY
jgi:hypothetical protein